MGDLHGRSQAIGAVDQLAENADVTAVIQVGDMGFFWPGSPTVEEYFIKRGRQNRKHFPWFVIDGNHENHDVLDEKWNANRTSVVEVLPGCFHVRRNTILEIQGIKHLFCGGARSTDRGPGNEFYRGNRIWWAQEAPNAKEIVEFHEMLEREKPDTVITHDVPNIVDLYRDGRFEDSTSRGFDNALKLSEHKPNHWFFGHHHLLDTFKDLDTVTFRGCGLHGQFWERDVDGNFTSHDKTYS